MPIVSLALLLAATHELKLEFPPGGPYRAATLVVTTRTFLGPFIGPIGGPDAEAWVILQVGSVRRELLHDGYKRDWDEFQSLDHGRLTVTTQADGFSWCAGACARSEAVWFGEGEIFSCDLPAAAGMPSLRALAFRALAGTLTCGAHPALRWAAAHPDPQLEVAMARWLTTGHHEHHEAIADALRPRLASNPAAAALIIEHYERLLRTPNAQDRDFYERYTQGLPGRPERPGWSLLPYWRDGGAASGRAQLWGDGGVVAEQTFDGGAVGFEVPEGAHEVVVVRASGAEPIIGQIVGPRHWSDAALRVPSRQLEVRVTRKGRPVPGAKVVVFDDRLPGAAERLLARGVSDERGVAKLDGLPHDLLRVETRVPGEPCDEHFVPADVLDAALFTLELTARTELAISVVEGGSPAPLPSLRVRVRRVGATDDCSERTVVTDELGRLVAPGLPPEGRYVLEARRPGKAPIELGEITPTTLGPLRLWPTR